MKPTDEFLKRQLEQVDRLMEGVPLPKVEPAEDGRGRNFEPGPAWTQQADGFLAEPLPERPASLAAARNGAFDAETYEGALRELDELVGLAALKAQVRAFASFARVESERRRLGHKSTGISLHSVFSGSPGTGKTTVARLLGRLLKAAGLLSSGHTLEVDKADLVAPYLGQTPGKVDNRVREALGGVLFIDEAYSLYDDKEDLYGREAISTLVKRMEDHREDLVVVAAGYPIEMERLLTINPGLRSRFGRTFDFHDYGVEELFEIFRRLRAAKGMIAAADFEGSLAEALKALHESGASEIGNARLVRSLFERTVEAQAVRLCSGAQWDPLELKILKARDLEIALRIVRKQYEG